MNCRARDHEYEEKGDAGSGCVYRRQPAVMIRRKVEVRGIEYANDPEDYGGCSQQTDEHGDGCTGAVDIDPFRVLSFCRSGFCCLDTLEASQEAR